MRGINRQSVIFGIAIAVFCVAAFIGWQKLQYGFNFIDEGYHMTEAWRLTAGDDFFKDKFTGALRSSTLINAVVFKACPDITLLGFRELAICFNDLFPVAFELCAVLREQGLLVSAAHIFRFCLHRTGSPGHDKKPVLSDIP